LADCLADFNLADVFCTQVAVFTGNMCLSPPILADPVADIGGIGTPDERPARLNAGTYSVIETRVVVNSWAVSWIMKPVGSQAFADKVISVSSDEVWYPSLEQLLAAGVITVTSAPDAETGADS
jgi:hypothetical protein